jgi:hypothetical protein
MRIERGSSSLVGVVAFKTKIGGRHGEQLLGEG